MDAVVVAGEVELFVVNVCKRHISQLGMELREHPLFKLVTKSVLLKIATNIL